MEENKMSWGGVKAKERFNECGEPGEENTAVREGSKNNVHAANTQSRYHSAEARIRRREPGAEVS